MRLGQLARKLSIGQTELISFLETVGLPSEGNANARLTQEQLEAVVSRFAPENHDLLTDVADVAEISELEVVDPETVEPVLQLENNDQMAAEVSDNGTETEISVESAVSEPELEELPDVIRAPKIELTGLKVIGKIELPEKKKPEPPQRPERESHREATERRQQRNRLNPVSLKRQQEELELQRKREAEREEEKKRKTERYHNRVRQQSMKPTRQLRKGVQEMENLPPEPPKTWWGRFLRWLTT